MSGIIDEIVGEEEQTPTEEVEETKPAVEPEPKPTDKPSTIPIGALHEERERRKELQEELRNTRDRMARMEALYGQLHQQQQRPATPLPAFDQDPVAHLKGATETLDQRLSKFEQETTKRAEQDVQQVNQRQLLEKYAADVRVFHVKQPDFQDAYNFLANAIDQDLQARGYDDPVERANVLEFEEGMLVGRAFKAGRSPAESIYNYAKTRGYAPAGDDNKLERIEKGQRAAKTLAGPGSKGEGAMSLERLADLYDSDPAAFDKEWEKARRRGLLG